MSIAPSAASCNHLLAALPQSELLQLLDKCEAVDLKFAEILAEPGEPIRHVYFPTRSAIVLVTLMDDRASLEVGLVGNEGIVGTALVLDMAVSPQRALVQGPGAALRMKAELFRQALEGSPELQHVLKRYVHAVMAQLAQTAGCTRFHLVEARLARCRARWPNMCSSSAAPCRPRRRPNWPRCWACAASASPGRPPRCRPAG